MRRKKRRAAGERCAVTVEVERRVVATESTMERQLSQCAARSVMSASVPRRKSRRLFEGGDPRSSSSSWVREMERSLHVGQAMAEASVRCLFWGG